MAKAKHVVAQRDFSAGQVDVELKRNDEHPQLKKGLRQAVNVRVLNSGGLKPRPGRRAIYPQSGRVDRVRLSPTVTYDLCFGTDGSLKVRNSSGTVVFTQAGLSWGATTLGDINWDIYGNDIYICFPGMRPRVLSWDGATTWSIANFAFTTTSGSQVRMPFYRISTKGVTLQPSGLTGSITLTASAAVFTSSAVGSYIRWLNHQLLITAFTSTTVVTATVIEQLPVTRLCTYNGQVGTFLVGDIVTDSAGVQGVVSAFITGNVSITITVFNAGDNVHTGTLVGPNGSCNITTAGGTTQAALTIWDEEVIGAYRGWPRSVAVDQNRLILSDLPGLPGGVSWSAIGIPLDHYVGANPADAMFELAPGKSRVRYVLPGPESNEFVFCDNAIYYIEISATNPLKPGSVVFSVLSADGCSACQPRRVQEYLIYSSAGSISLNAVVATGAYRRPFEVRALNEVHAELFDDPVAIAAPSAESQFPERYVYVLNSDNSIAVAQLPRRDGQIVLAGELGWVPWTGEGTVSWISAFEAVTIFVESFQPTGTSIAEELDADEYLDGAVHVNAAPAAMAGSGDLWVFANGTADLIDQSTRTMGTYALDANGDITPQMNAGEDLTLASLVGGKSWTMTVEPFVPAVQPGQDVQQRLDNRQIAWSSLYVKDSTGFYKSDLFGGPLRPSGPALGAEMNKQRIPAWNQDDDPLDPPPEREQIYSFRHIGTWPDPRVAYVKDTPGPLTIVEIAMEVTV